MCTRTTSCPIKRSARWVIAAALIVLAAALAPSFLSAQSSSATYAACYVPRSGTVYRIKAPNTPSACTKKDHVEFSWTEAGMPGPRGPAGPQGPQGPPDLHPAVVSQTDEMLASVAWDEEMVSSGVDKLGADDSCRSIRPQRHVRVHSCRTQRRREARDHGDNEQHPDNPRVGRRILRRHLVQ